jgi:chromate transporter
MDVNWTPCDKSEEVSGDMHFLYKIFTTFFKIGAFTFGGGFAMIPLIQREVVDENGWMDSDEFIDIISVTQSAPGAVSVNTAVFIGYKLAGLPGAIIATLGTVLPSFFIILAIATFFTKLKGMQVVEWIFLGIRPAVVALVLVAASSIGRRVILQFKYLILSIIALALLILVDIHPVLLILSCAVLGGIFFKPNGTDTKNDE